MTANEKQKEIVELVKARLETMPSDAILSIGGNGKFNRRQLISEVENDTPVGRKIIEIQMRYLRLLKEGIFYANTPDHPTQV